MSKFNVFNDDNIKKQPDAKPQKDNTRDQESNNDETRAARRPILMGRVVNADLMRREMVPQPVYVPTPVNLSRVLTMTMGLPDEMEVSVMVGDDEFTLLRPIVGNRYYNATAVEFTISAPGQYLRLRSLRSLAHNNTDMGAIFRINGRDIINIEIDSARNRFVMSA